jgi:hypothetical protein
MSVVSENPKPVVVVTGDVTMDWNMVSERLKGVDQFETWTPHDSAWLSCQRGGAALLADVIESVCAPQYKVAKVDAPDPEDIRPTDGRVHHSYARWQPETYDWTKPRYPVWDGYDLRLMSSVDDVSGIPTGGKSLIIVAAVDNVLHFRIFDGDGEVVVVTDEKRLTEQARQIEDLGKQLESLWPPHELTRSEKSRVITAVTSIVGHTLSDNNDHKKIYRYSDPLGFNQSELVKDGSRGFKVLAYDKGFKILDNKDTNTPDDKDAALLVLNDAGLGFRDHDEYWPMALRKENWPGTLRSKNQRWFVVKLGGPLPGGPLWKERLAQCYDRLIVVLNVGVLRSAGLKITPSHSWERVAQDVYRVVGDTDGLRDSLYVVVSLGTAGCILLSDINRYFIYHNDNK